MSMRNIMRKAVFTLGLALLCLTFVVAQDKFPSQVWHKGNIYTTNGNVKGGLVKYDLDNNLVQLKGEAIETFTASNVSNFEIFDEVYGGVRKFYSLPYALNNDYQTPIFFEVLTQGDELALLCREYVMSDTKNMNTGFGYMGMSPYNGSPGIMGQRLAFNFYFFRNGSIEKYSMKKKDLFEMLPGYDDEMDLFIRKNRLNHDKRGDLLQITSYYNNLIK